jgi:hypothetical protein
VVGPPPGLAVTLTPVYLAWRVVRGPVDSHEAFLAFHVFATLALAATVSALLAGEVFALAGALGASRAGRLWAALLCAFGTPAFLFAARLFKENLAALAVIVAVRLAVETGGPARRAAAGFAAGLAALVAYPAGLIAPGLAALLGAREGRRSLAAFLAGWLPPLTALALYNTWLFGRPWRFAYSTYLNLPEAAASVGWHLPDAAVLLNSLVHQREGLLLYSPFLVLGVVGLVAAWRAGHRLLVTATVLFTLALWALSAAWLARFPSAFTGARYLFAAVPLLAAFAGPVLERVSGRLRGVLAVASVGLTYLAVQAGHIADPAPLVYALKTFVSGGGLPVLFKETLPAALGLETLHTLLGRADVGVRDLPALLATSAGWRLALNQALVTAAGVLVLGAIAWIVSRLWSHPVPARAPAPSVAAR